MTETGKKKRTSKVRFDALYLGDRFKAHDRLWTKIDWDTARRHSEAGLALGGNGMGYIGDAITSFDHAKKVVFEAPAI
ncbi:hypothetical protein [Burkholderia cenocepacia]|uniref:hypothetical protein n=1 Tax=Burkholderia cenocepacia TaxID=95486 RepID=UPI000761473A|nr:hypothetical protein [Burkholderia cenocepacia]KWU19200.1 hypothetical protein AS149_13215 [Burkholderia cenocepacia]